MAWYNSVVNGIGGGVKKVYNGISDAFSGPSTNPADYRAPFQDRQQILNATTAGMATNRTAPRAGMDGAFRNSQLQQMAQLQGIASGQQQGAGELAVQRQAQNAQAAQQAMMRMRGGGAGGGLAALNQANASAGIGSSAMGMGQQAAMGDQQMAHGMLANVSGQGRGQDQQMQLANLDAQLKQMGMDDAQRLGYLQQLTGMNAAELQAGATAMGAANAGGSTLGRVAQVAGPIIAAMAMSDERAKTDIADAGEDIDQMLDSLRAKSYTYKDQERHGKGPRAGVMVQDLAKSKAGSALVVDMPNDPGLQGFDINKAVSAALASSARLNERMRKLERKAG